MRDALASRSAQEPNGSSFADSESGKQQRLNTNKTEFTHSADRFINEIQHFEKEEMLAAFRIKLTHMGTRFSQHAPNSQLEPTQSSRWTSGIEAQELRLRN
jgi:hypothetical protein